jgi:hypothetical protein
MENGKSKNCPSFQSPDIPLEELQAHAEWKQVELDVARTLSRFPPGIDDLKRETLQEQLARLIVRILCENKQFHYYQGELVL